MLPLNLPWFWWRRQVAYLPQEPVFLDATVRDNLLAARPEAQEAELVRCPGCIAVLLEHDGAQIEVDGVVARIQHRRPGQLGPGIADQTGTGTAWPMTTRPRAPDSTCRITSKRWPWNPYALDVMHHSATPRP